MSLEVLDTYEPKTQRERRVFQEEMALDDWERSTRRLIEMFGLSMALELMHERMPKNGTK